MNATPSSLLETSKVSVGQLVAQEGDAWRLENGVVVQPSLSCLVTPMEGDLVLYVSAMQGAFVLHVLARKQDAPLVIGEHGTDFQLHSRNLSLKAAGEIQAMGARGMDVAVPGGRLSMTAGEISLSAFGSLIQHAARQITQVGDWLATVGGYFRLNTKRTHLTSKAETKIDADIIHMG